MIDAPPQNYIFLLKSVGVDAHIDTQTKNKHLNPIILLLILIIITGASAIFRNAILCAAIGIISAIIFFVNCYK